MKQILLGLSLLGLSTWVMAEPCTYNEAILALENAILREELLQSQNNLQQIDRLRSVEAMTEGIAQELHNPLMSIKAFVQLAELRRHDKEFMDTLHRVVGDDLAKIEQLTKEIREYVKPLSDSENRKVDIDESIKSCLLFFSNNPAYDKVQFETHFDSFLPVVPIDRQGLMQVMFNSLLLLLKQKKPIDQILRIQAEVDRKSIGQCWVILHFSWVIPQSSIPVKVFAGGTDDLEPVLFESLDGSEKRGLILASQIIQRFSGSFDLLKDSQERIVGIRIKIPAHSFDVNQTLVSQDSSSLIQVQDR